MGVWLRAAEAHFDAANTTGYGKKLPFSCSTFHQDYPLSGITPLSPIKVKQLVNDAKL